jgi:hypothetical protein
MSHYKTLVLTLILFLFQSFVRENNSLQKNRFGLVWASTEHKNGLFPVTEGLCGKGQAWVFVSEISAFSECKINFSTPWYCWGIGGYPIYGKSTRCVVGQILLADSQRETDDITSFFELIVGRESQPEKSWRSVESMGRRVILWKDIHYSRLELWYRDNAFRNGAATKIRHTMQIQWYLCQRHVLQSIEKIPIVIRLKNSRSNWCFHDLMIVLNENIISHESSRFLCSVVEISRGSINWWAWSDNDIKEW